MEAIGDGRHRAGQQAGHGAGQAQARRRQLAHAQVIVTQAGIDSTAILNGQRPR